MIGVDEEDDEEGGTSLRFTSETNLGFNNFLRGEPSEEEAGDKAGGARESFSGEDKEAALDWEAVEGFTGEVGDGELWLYQSISSLDFCLRKSLVLEKCLHPKNPNTVRKSLSCHYLCQRSGAMGEHTSKLNVFVNQSTFSFFGLLLPIKGKQHQNSEYSLL